VPNQANFLERKGKIKALKERGREIKTTGYRDKKFLVAMGFKWGELHLVSEHFVEW
jgi:hypothetical protein